MARPMAMSGAALHSWPSWGSRVALGLATIALLWQLTGLFWQLIIPDEQLPPLVIQPRGTQASGVNYSDFQPESLFGETIAIASTEVSLDAPPTELALELLGTLAGIEPRSGRAFISAPQTGQFVASSGDELPGGAELVGIFRDRVTLRVDGRLESLLMSPPEDESGGAPVASADRVVGARVNSVATGAGVRAAGQLGTQQWAQFRQQAITNPLALAEYVRAVPYTENGEQVGVRLLPGRDARAFAQLGLRPSDVVTQVNGIELNDPSKLPALLEQLREGSRFDLVIRRGGQPTNLTIDLEGG